MNTKTVHGRLRPGRRFLTRPDGVVCEQWRQVVAISSISSLPELSCAPRRSKPTGHDPVQESSWATVSNWRQPSGHPPCELHRHVPSQPSCHSPCHYGFVVRKVKDLTSRRYADEFKKLSRKVDFSAGCDDGRRVFDDFCVSQATAIRNPKHVEPATT